MKKLIYIAIAGAMILSVNCSAGGPKKENAKPAAGGEVTQLSDDSFRKLVFNYEANKSWKYEGNMPAVIDFYADWCPPCRMLSPLVEEIAKEYDGKIVVYKVNTDKERKLAQSLGIESLPTLLFIPAKGEPHVSLGYIPKENLVKFVDDMLIPKKEN